MSTRAWAVGAAAFLAAGGILWAPRLATGQTLVDQSAAAGVAGDLNSRAAANGASAMQRVRGRVAGADDRAREADAVMDQMAPAAGMRRGVVPSGPSANAWVVPVSALARKELRAQAMGRIVRAEGTIESVEVVGGRKVFRIDPAGSDLGAKDRIVVQVPQGEASLGAPGEAATAFGAFRQAVTSRRGVTVLVFDQGQIVSRIAPGASSRAGAAADAKAEAPPAPRSFAGPLAGWRLEGTVSGEAGSTAVFASPGGRVFFVKPGQRFGGEYVLASVGSGQADVKVGGSVVSVIAW